MKLIHNVYYTSVPTPAVMISDYLKKDGHAKDSSLTDFRFFKDSTNIANSTLMRLNGCMVLQTQFGALSDLQKANTFFAKTLVYSSHLLLKPLAACGDLVLNIALLIIKVAFSVLILATKGLYKVISPKSDQKIYATASLILKNLSHHTSATFLSLRYFTVQSFTSSLINLLGPKFDPFFRLGSHFHWGYWLADSGQFILDQARVQYLQTECGFVGNEFHQAYFLQEHKPILSASVYGIFDYAKEHLL